MDCSACRVCWYAKSDLSTNPVNLTCKPNLDGSMPEGKKANGMIYMEKDEKVNALNIF